jgi:hypothetical protein
VIAVVPEFNTIEATDTRKDFEPFPVNALQLDLCFSCFEGNLPEH